MKAVYGEQQAEHDPQFFLVKGQPRRSTEQPERAQRLLAGVARCGLEVVTPDEFGASPRAAVHDATYLDFLDCAFSEWSALPESTAEVIANVHPMHRRTNYPHSIIGRAGWHMADTACPIGKHTFKAACVSANCALTATQQVVDGARYSYALCRPPGHHAYADMAGGFCFLNNAAIAAQYARNQHQRVAILDVDVHHGNGTQGIFYDRQDVLTISVHADPSHFYPFFWGHANECGEAEGEGYNLNLPLHLLSGDGAFLSALEQASHALADFNPGLLLVALGLDASESDPLRGLSVTTPGFRQIGSAIADLNLPTVFVQEGGYLSDVLTDSLAAVLEGVLS
ncbi:acetylpolyamine aminohydrolase [Chromatiales bacterium (ex Bugula neritina AB1)]|nr:acetylpolyamine aminohydrolase [Chromatiales bacterium (ex Bugula neritina AB1)]